MRLSRFLTTAAVTGLATKGLMMIPAYRRRHSPRYRALRLARAVGGNLWVQAAAVVVLTYLARRGSTTA